MKPLVSVLMPVFNAEPWLAQTVGCVLEQTWPRIELIMVDDGSRDQSLAIARRFEGQNVKIISQENGGPGLARARALAAAQGEYIQYLDADDLLTPAKIELQMQQLEREAPGYVAACSWGRFYGDDHLATVFQQEPVWANLDPVSWLVTSHEGGGMMPAHAWLTPRGVAEQAGGWDERRSLNDDGEYFARVLLASRGVLFVPEARVYYRSGVNGWSGNRAPEAVSGLYRSLESISSNLLAAEDSPRTRHALATAYQRFVYDIYPEQAQVTRAAEARVRELGGTTLKPDGGPAFRYLRNVLGWRSARLVQQYFYRIRSHLRSFT